MQTGEAAVSFTLHVVGDREQLATWGAEALLSVSESARQSRRLVAVMAVLFVAGGLVLLLTGVSTGVGAVMAGVVVWLAGVRRGPAVRRLSRSLLQNPFAYQPTTYVADPSGLSLTTDGYQARWAWYRFARVVDHQGGLVLVYEGGTWMADFPPAAFMDEHQRALFRQYAEAWIAAARANLHPTTTA